MLKKKQENKTQDGNCKNLHEEITQYKLKYQEVPLHQITTKQYQSHCTVKAITIGSRVKQK